MRGEGLDLTLLRNFSLHVLMKRDKDIESDIESDRGSDREIVIERER